MISFSFPEIHFPSPPTCKLCSFTLHPHIDQFNLELAEASTKSLWLCSFSTSRIQSPCQEMFSDLGFPDGRQMVVLVTTDTVICLACYLDWFSKGVAKVSATFREKPSIQKMEVAAVVSCNNLTQTSPYLPLLLQCIAKSLPSPRLITHAGHTHLQNCFP